MKKVFLSIFLFFISISFTYAKTDVVMLDKCIDGDTATFILNDETKTYRFLSINAPEVKTEKYGKESSDYVCRLLKDAKEIIIEYDDKATTDKYDRILAWIWLDKKLLQESIVADGYAEVAYVYDEYKYTNSLCATQNNAIKSKYNIWSDGTREEDYCAQVDLNNVKNNITFPTENIINDNGEIDLDSIKDQISEEDYEELEKVTDALEKMNKISDKVSNITSKIGNAANDNTSTLVIIIFIIAGGYLILKEIKNNKK